MTPRFLKEGSAPNYIGVTGKDESVSADGRRDDFPTSSDGTLADGTTFLDLKTGCRWYYDGDGWFRMSTPEERAVDELKALRQDLTVAAERQNSLLSEIRDLLRQIA